jgi:hypothetical protein
MDKSSLVRRTQNAAWRGSARPPETVERDWYDQDMKALGRDRAPLYSGDEKGRPFSGLGELLSHPVSFGVICLLAFGLVFSVLLWRDGRFDGLFKFPSSPIASNDWMAGKKGQVASLEEESATGDIELPPNEMESMLELQKAERQARIDASVEALYPEAAAE